MTIHVVDVATGQVTNVDKALNWLHGALANVPRELVERQPLDGVLARPAEWPERDLHLTTRAAGGAPHQVTSGYYNDRSPSFDPDGKYLYFLSGRSFNPSYSDLDNSWAYVNSTNIVVAPLRADVPSPLAPAQRRGERRRRSRCPAARGRPRAADSSARRWRRIRNEGREHRLRRFRAPRRGASPARRATTPA